MWAALAIFLWAVVVAALCFFALAILVGNAFRRRGPAPGVAIAGAILKPGTAICPQNAPAGLFLSWLLWTIAGGVVLFLVLRDV